MCNSMGIPSIFSWVFANIIEDIWSIASCGRFSSHHIIDWPIKWLYCMMCGFFSFLGMVINFIVRRKKKITATGKHLGENKDVSSSSCCSIF